MSETFRYVVWGFKNRYHTHSHIHEGFFRALEGIGREVLWLDDLSAEMSGRNLPDFSNTMFITEHGAAKQGMPIRDDCFYVIHGLNDDPEMSAKMSGIKNRLSWNVYHDYAHGNSDRWDGQPIETVESYNAFLAQGLPDTEYRYDRVFIAEDAPFYPREKRVDFRWATDLLPHEIDRLTPLSFPGPTRTINWVGTQWFVNQKELGEFKRACSRYEIDFKAVGAGQNGVVTIPENINLVRNSYFAPAIVGSHHIAEGYAPCRIFKNISYGAMGVTNSKRVNDVFGGRLIYNPDPYELFHQAVEELPKVTPESIRGLMDYVAKNHTYLNRLDVIHKAAKLVMEMK